MAVKILYRKKKSCTLDTLYIEQKSTDFEILPFDNHLFGSPITNLRHQPDHQGGVRQDRAKREGGAGEWHLAGLHPDQA